jgi:pimeloyl-ACP methyl ester carboxylesterase
MDAVGIDRAHLLGLSMGGMIAQEIAINTPARVRSLQLHSTMAKPDAYLSAVVEGLVRAKAALSQEEFTRGLLVWLLTPRTYNEQPELVETLVRGMVESPCPATLEGFIRQAEACAAHDSLDRLHRIQCPTLITVGANDILVPPRFSQTLRERIPGSELSVISGGGHGALWEQPQVFNELCLGFLKTRAASSNSP